MNTERIRNDIFAKTFKEKEERELYCWGEGESEGSGVVFLKPSHGMHKICFIYINKNKLLSYFKSQS